MGFSLFNKPYDLYNYKGISEVMIAQNDGSANGCLSVNIKTDFCLITIPDFFVSKSVLK